MNLSLHLACHIIRNIDQELDAQVAEHIEQLAPLGWRPAPGRNCQGHYKSAHTHSDRAPPTGLIAGKPAIRVIYLNPATVLELVHVHDHIRATRVRLTGKEDAGISVGQHQIGEYPSRWFDMQLEFQVPPSCVVPLGRASRITQQTRC